jgi:hypothetical protein
MENKNSIIGKKVGIIGGVVEPVKTTQHIIVDDMKSYDTIYVKTPETIEQLKDVKNLRGKTIIITGNGDAPDEIELRKKLAIAANQEVIFLTPEQAKQIEPERGIILSDLRDLHNKQLESLSKEIEVLQPNSYADIKDGRASRRERRANERKSQQNKKL